MNYNWKLLFSQCFDNYGLKTWKEGLLSFTAYFELFLLFCLSLFLKLKIEIGLNEDHGEWVPVINNFCDFAFIFLIQLCPIGWDIFLLLILTVSLIVWWDPMSRNMVPGFISNYGQIIIATGNWLRCFGKNFLPLLPWKKQLMNAIILLRGELVVVVLWVACDSFFQRWEIDGVFVQLYIVF